MTTPVPKWQQTLLKVWGIYSAVIIVICSLISAAISFAGLELGVSQQDINIAVGCLGLSTLFVQLVNKQIESATGG